MQRRAQKKLAAQQASARSRGLTKHMEWLRFCCGAHACACYVWHVTGNVADGMLACPAEPLSLLIPSTPRAAPFVSRTRSPTYQLIQRQLMSSHGSFSSTCCGKEPQQSSGILQSEAAREGGNISRQACQIACTWPAAISCWPAAHL